MVKAISNMWGTFKFRLSNMWGTFKFRFKNFWRFLLGKEPKIRLGWVLYEEVGIVILNDEAIIKIDIEK
jgi:hypothetical protein